MSPERVSPETERLLRFLDREMSAEEANAFRAELSRSPQLREELAKMQRVGALVRSWAEGAAAQSGDLLEPTLVRVRDAERTRARHTTLGYAVATLLLLALTWWRQTPQLAAAGARVDLATPTGAAIERIEVGDEQAQVFVVGASSTPVVWLADDVPDDDASEQQDPG